MGGPKKKRLLPLTPHLYPMATSEASAPPRVKTPEAVESQDVEKIQDGPLGFEAVMWPSQSKRLSVVVGPWQALMVKLPQSHVHLWPETHFTPW